MFATFQYLIVFVVSVAAFVGAIWALVDSLRYPNSAYVSAGKNSKVLWGALLGAAAAIAIVSLPPPIGIGGGILGILGLAAIIVVLIYFVEVRKRLQEHHQPGRRGDQRGGRGGW